MSITAALPLSRIVTTGLLFLLTLLSGVWVSALGRPLNSLVFGMHKLIAVGTIVLLGMSVYQLWRVLDTRSFLEVAAVGVTGLLLLALLASGILLSFEVARPAIVLLVHQVAPVLALAGSVAVLFLLAGSRS